MTIEINPPPHKPPPRVRHPTQKLEFVPYTPSMTVDRKIRRETLSDRILIYRARMQQCAGEMTLKSLDPFKQ